jgi:hypothetical protein
VYSVCKTTHAAASLPGVRNRAHARRRLGVDGARVGQRDPHPAGIQGGTDTRTLPGTALPRRRPHTPRRSHASAGRESTDYTDDTEGKKSTEGTEAQRKGSASGLCAGVDSLSAVCVPRGRPSPPVCAAGGSASKRWMGERSCAGRASGRAARNPGLCDSLSFPPAAFPAKLSHAVAIRAAGVRRGDPNRSRARDSYPTPVTRLVAPDRAGRPRLLG